MTAAVFPNAVASFDPTASSVLLWARLGGGATETAWVLARDPELTDVVASGSATTGPDRASTVTVDVVDLEPARTYWYRFDAHGAHSPVGRTRTLPSGDVERFRIGTVCCAHFAEAPLGVYRALAEREVDVVLHLGDYIYEEGGTGEHRRHDPPHDAVTLDDYRRRLAQVRSDPDAQALHLRHPVVAIWDDHDFCDNAWRHGAKRHDPSRHGPWPDRVRAARQARDEWLPSHARPDGDERTTWRSMPLGDLAELVLLDTRLAGRDEQAGDDASQPLDDPHRSLLGNEQRDWLGARLADGTRPWSIVASGVVVNALELDWPRPLRWMDRLLPAGYAIQDGRMMHDDQWDGYPAERRWLVQHLRARAAEGGRTVLLSGDVHSSWAFHGPTDPSTGSPVAVEFTTPAVSSAAMGRARYPGLWRILDREASRLDHVEWSDVTNRGYTIVDITLAAVTSQWWFVHPYDHDPAGRASLAAAYTTRRDAWPPRLEAVEDPGADPCRVGLPQDLPDRPQDLASIRRRRRIRLVAKAAAGPALCGVLAATIRRHRG